MIIAVSRLFWYVRAHHRTKTNPVFWNIFFYYKTWSRIQESYSEKKYWCAKENWNELQSKDNLSYSTSLLIPVH